MKVLEELNEEQRKLAERLRASASQSIEQRKKNSFCPRCRFEQTANFNEYG